MPYKNEFRISKEQIDRIKNFSASAQYTSQIHNINNYWKFRCDYLNFKTTKKGILINNFSSLPSRIAHKKIYKFICRMFFLKILSIIFMKSERIMNMKNLLNAEKLISDKTEVFLHDYRNNPFVFKKTPISSIISSWPTRTIIMLRALDVIHHFSNKIKNKKLKVLEIGAGPCILTGLMMHKMNTKHVIVDLSQEIIIGFSFLSEFFPDKKLVLPNEVAEKGIPDDADVVFLTPEQIKPICSQKFDIFINIFSFQEMSYKTIREYFDLMRTCSSKQSIFYCLNRTNKPNKYDNTISEFEKYPWSNADNFLHKKIIDKYLAGLQICGSETKEVVVKLNPVKYNYNLKQK